MARHIGMLSSGVSSAYACKLMIDEVGKENSILFFTDTLMEDEDNYRFLVEIVLHLGATYVKVDEGMNPFDFFDQKGMLGSDRVPICSEKLKLMQTKKFVKEGDTLWWGIDWEEKHRAEPIERNWKESGIHSRFPLIEQLTLHQTRFDWLREIGIRPPRMYELGFSHANCFHGQTRFITSAGIRTLEDCAGETVKVIGAGKSTPWRDAEIKSFGKQELLSLKLSRNGATKTVRATAEHRWFIRAGRTHRRERTTLELVPGDRLFSAYARIEPNVRPSAVGIMHGIVYGDGSRPKTNQPARLLLVGEKAELAPYFGALPQTLDKDGNLEISDLPRYFKDPPPLKESKSYLYGFLAGYFATDGSASKSTYSMSSANAFDMGLVEDIAAVLGIGANPTREQWRKGFGETETPLFSVSFVAATLREDFFLRSRHRAAFKPATARPSEWQVVSVERTGEVDEVYCAVVPEGHAFTLEHNILTGNCSGMCVRGKLGHWAHLYRVWPDRYAYAEQREQGWQEKHGKDNTILRKSIGGEYQNLSLKRFREEYLEGQLFTDTEFSDSGSCACMAVYAGGEDE